MFRHPSEPLESHIWCVVHTHLHPVVAGWAKPQQPSQQPGRTALSGKQAGVREEGDGHRRAELGGRLSVSCSLLLPLHHSVFIIPVLQSLIFTSSRRKKKQQLYQKNSSATTKKDTQRTTKPEWTLSCLPIHLSKMREGKSILYLCFLSLIFLFLLHDVK